MAPNATGIVRRRVTSLNTEQVIVRNVASTELPYVKPLAGSCAWIGLKKNFKVHEDDEDEVPRFIPYFGDAASDIGEEAVRLFTNSKLRIKLPVNPVADKVYAGVTKMFPPSEEVLREIGISFGLPVDYFTDRYPSDAKAPDEAAAKAEKTNAKAEYDPKEANKRLFDSYKNLFCRRCYVYDCRDHGAGQPIPDCRDDAAMSIINTGTVLANAPLVQAMTISKADLQRAGAGGAVGGDGGQSPTDRDAASPVLGQSAAAPSARARRLPDSSGSAGLKSSAKASASGQASVAAELEEAFCSDVCYRCFSAPKSAAAAGAKWSDIEEVSFSKSVQLCGRAPCRVSRLMRSRTCAEVWAKMEANPDTGEKEAVVLSKAALLKRQQQLHIARRNAYYKRHKLMEKTAEPGANSLPALGENALPEYVPCRHEGACTVENGCACAKKNMMCEKFCACSSECKNRWAGCTCKRSRCNTRACPCYAAGRECDPDLCHGCGACLHPESIPDSDVRRCLNVPLQTGHHKHLWLGPSGVHGWGGFVTQPLEKNEFIHEYVGETISQQEAERRGRVYDVQRLSFLFNLSDTTVVDATRKGNKTKFINHASSNASRNNLQANVEVRYVLARGERHVCMYAQRDIAANEEVRATALQPHCFQRCAVPRCIPLCVCMFADYVVVVVAAFL